MNTAAKLASVAAALRGALAQEPGDVSPADVHPTISLQECSSPGDCEDKKVKIVLDSNWRWMHKVGGYSNCIDDASGTWDPEVCPDSDTCTKGCAIEGLNATQYSDTYGVSAGKDGLTLKYVPGSRVYILDGDEYYMFNLLNKEFTFTVDLSTLPCGTNAALYLIEMEKDGSGGAGAPYGTGYCDAQCPQASKYVKGKANSEDWKKILVETPEYEWTEVGPQGSQGACCAEFDIMEANTMANALTAHPCSIEGLKPCESEKDCGNKSAGLPGWCDKDGCGHNPFRLGDKKFYGPGSDFKVDSSKPFTVVTQFITDNDQDDGELVEVRRQYVQGGKVIKNSAAPVLHHEDYKGSLDNKMCEASVKKFNVTSNKKHKKTRKNRAWMDTFKLNGEMKTMGEAIGRGMVMALSVWDDGLGRMNWLDSEKTLIDQDPHAYGVARGPCKFEEGVPKVLQKENKKAYVTFSDLKMGPIGSTLPEGAEVPEDDAEEDDEETDAEVPEDDAEGDDEKTDAVETVSDFSLGRLSVNAGPSGTAGVVCVAGAAAAALAAVVSAARRRHRTDMALLAEDEESTSGVTE